MNRPLWVALAWAALLALVAAVAPAFFDPVNLRDLVVRASPLLIVACGMTIVILARQIDISVGSQFAICGVVAGLLAREGLPMPLVALGTMGAGAGLGRSTGCSSRASACRRSSSRWPRSSRWREGLRFATEGVWVQDLPAGFQWFGLGQDIGRWLVGVAAAAVWAAVAFVLGWTPAGRAVYATGSDAEVARLLGVRPPVVIAGAFVVMGALTGLAALLSAVQFIDVQANAGIGLELSVIAAVVVGGTAVSGGRGSLTGTLAGVALLATVGPALTFLGAPAAWERALQGAIILIAVVGRRLLARARPRGTPCRSGRRRPATRRRQRAAARRARLATPEIVLLALLIGELVVVLARRHQLPDARQRPRDPARQRRGRPAGARADAGDPHRRHRPLVRRAARPLGRRLRRDLARRRAAAPGRRRGRARRRPPRRARSTRGWSPASAGRR